MAFDLSSAQEVNPIEASSANQKFDMASAVDVSHPSMLGNAENILQRVASTIKNDFIPQQQSNPFMQGIQSTMQGLKGTPGLGPYMVGHDVKSAAINNPLLDFASDPETLIGAKGMVKGAGSGIKSMFNPSGQYGKALASKTGTVDMYKPIMDALDDPVASKYLDKADILSKYGGRTLGEGGSVTENLKNLSPQDSQNLINDLKDTLSQKTKEGILKSGQLKLGQLLSDLTEAHNAAFPGMETARSMYGFGKNAQKFGEKAVKAAIFGGEASAGGALAWPFIKKMVGR